MDETAADGQMTEAALKKANDRIDDLEHKVSDLEGEVAQLKSRMP
jgi:tetrahydromethanopterin S-methyltransferase subunit G